jgi:hypothetical protein
MKSSNKKKLVGSVEKMVGSLGADGGNSNVGWYSPLFTDLVPQQWLPLSCLRVMERVNCESANIP